MLNKRTDTLLHLRRRRSLGLAALVTLGMLLLGFVVHPIVHDHGCETEECLLAQCMSVAQVVPEVCSTEVDLVFAEAPPLEKVVSDLAGSRVPASSRGPPALTS